ncbi:MAG TPA: non-ribosomal peptide synthetase [Ktedonobacteraceae bacterium]|nr:non-ribosomal peptide synthetase [Ktedonobacteraceae bacterium]
MVISLLTENEQRLLAAWNDTSQDYARDACIPQLIARQASIRPRAIALVADGEVVTYEQLNRRANRLAHHLQSLGVGSGSGYPYVGCYLERSIDLVVALLAILKAGAAYVPLDPAYPSERVAFMLADANVPVLVTKASLAGRLANYHAQIVRVDADAALLAQQSEVDPPALATVDDLAYVIYTSGSTGRPKGVQITHDNLLNMIYWHQRAFAVTLADRATQLTSPAFDATGWELWPYLTIGASVYLPDEETRVSPARLRDWLLGNRITISFLPTALAEHILTLEWPSQAPLRFLLTGADRLRHYPPAHLPFTLINNYGPSEATVLATSGEVLASDACDEPPTIGRPIANTHIYLLDEQLRQVPIGEPGEIYIGGAGVGKGYLNRPELTEERFLPDPFRKETGARMYKTGDLGRFLPDGRIAFLGRADDQIKLRGFRIEPEEIIAVLNAHPAIETSVVVARAEQGNPDEKRLVAYLVLAPGVDITVDALRAMLAERLPEYMIPATFVRLNTLPITPNGKIDRHALPAPDASNTLQDEQGIVLPTTPMEEHVAAIVSSLLGLEQVSIDDNFFMLGGHSLLGTQVIARIASTFDVELTLRSLFEAPTVRQLSALIERRILARLESMSDEEALQLLARKG